MRDISELNKMAQSWAQRLFPSTGMTGKQASVTSKRPTTTVGHGETLPASSADKKAKLYAYLFPIKIDPKNYGVECGDPEDALISRPPFCLNNCYLAISLQPRADMLKEAKDAIRSRRVDENIAAPFTSFDLSMVADADIEESIKDDQVTIIPLKHGTFTISVLDG